jgi:uncharacterized protein involved in exopolysaccharide biosynthesis/MinD-like ATPase involved in chromosome partitioning or flagellar assembly
MAAVWRRRGLIATVTLLLTAADLVGASLLPKMYRADTLLQSDPRAGFSIDGNAAVTATPADMDGGALTSQVEVIRSPSVILRAIEIGNLAVSDEYRKLTNSGRGGAGPLSKVVQWFRDRFHAYLPPIEKADERLAARRQEDRILNYFDKSLEVDYDMRGNSLRIRARNADPFLAATIANAVADAYVEKQLSRKLDLVKSTGQWLDQRLQGLQEKVDTAEAKLVEFQQQHNLGAGQSTSFTRQQLGDLNGQLATALSQEAEATAKARAADEASRSRRLGDMPEALASETMRALREQESMLSRRVAELSSGGNMRTAADVRAEWAELRKRIAEEQERILSATRSQAEVARARRQALTTLIQRLSSEVDERQRFAVQAEVLERNLVTQRAVLDAAMRRAEVVQTLSGLQRPDLSIVSRARVPTEPFKPNLTLVAAVGFIASLAMATGAALLIELRRLSVRSLAQGEAALGIHGIGWLPKVRKPRRYSFLEFLREHSSGLYEDCLRTIVAAIPVRRGGRGQMILVTSTIPGEGKTSFAVSLGRGIVASGQSCVLLDFDQRRPALTRDLGLRPQSTALSLLGSDTAIREMVQVDAATGLAVIRVAGDEDAGEAFRDEATARRIISFAKENYEVVVVDAPAVLSTSDACVLARTADTVLLVVAWARTPIRTVLHALDRLNRAGATSVAFMLSRVDPAGVARGEDERLAHDHAYVRQVPRRRQVKIAQDMQPSGRREALL